MFSVVTGATGHLGANLVRVLLAKGRRVRVLVRQDTRGIDGLDVERVSGDLLDAPSLDRAFAGATTVFNCAGRIALSTRAEMGSFDVNTIGVRNVTQACLSAGVKRLVHVSSVHALAEHPFDRPIVETNGPVPKDAPALPYTLSKAAGEREILAAAAQGLQAVIINPTSIVGPHDFKLSRMGEAIRDLVLNRFPALLSASYDYVDARDVSVAALLAEERGTPGERYLVGGHSLTLRDLAVLVSNVTGSRVPKFDCPMWVARAVAPVATIWSQLRGRRPKFTSAALKVLRGNTRVDDSKIRSELGYAPRPILETVRETVAWQREAGILP